ncbi:MAG: GAF domain-containing protein [Chloroflexi bacterium]|nr:GAF domain-containing protein [Chloroflexota bacterium]
MQESVAEIMVVFLDDPSQPAGDRWANIQAIWDREDKPYDGPRQLKTNEGILRGIENTPADGNIFNDIEQDYHIDPLTKSMLQERGFKAAATFPLMAGRRTVGWLTLGSRNYANAFSDSDAIYYETLTDQAATSYESIRLIEQTRIRARRLQAANEVSRSASSILSPSRLLKSVSEQVREAFAYDHVQIFTANEAGDRVVLRASTGDLGQRLLQEDYDIMIGDQTPVGQAARTGNAVIVRDTQVELGYIIDRRVPETRSQMVLPLKRGNSVTGVIDMHSYQPNAFDEEAQAILQSLAGEIAVSLENTNLFQEIQKRVTELTRTNTMMQSITRSETLDDLYDTVTVQFLRELNTRYAYVGVINEENMIEIPVLIESGERLPAPDPIPMGQGISSYVIQSRQQLVINGDGADRMEELGAVIIGDIPHSLLAVPLLLGDEVIGVVSVQDNDPATVYDQSQIRLLSTLAAYLAVKIKNAQLLEEAQRRAGELSFLFNVTRAAVESSDLQESLTNVANLLRNEIDSAESAIIYLVDEHGEMLIPQAAVGFGREIAARSPGQSLGEGIIGNVFVGGHSLLINDVKRDLGGRTLFGDEDDRTQSAVLVPLRAQDESIGVLTVESTRINAFDETTVNLVQTASSTLTGAINTSRLLEEVNEAYAQLAETDELKTQFLANMSHELRTPLNSIIGFSRVMLKGINGPLNDAQQQDLNTIYTSGRHLLGLINSILDMSKITAGKMEVHQEYISIEEIVDTVVAAGKGLIKDKPLGIFKEVDGNLPLVWGDEVKIRQVMFNLISNAAKFTFEGSITIRARRQNYNPKTGEPPRVQIDVVDTGVGIPDSHIGTIFEAFRQVDGSTTRQVGGTGLGLPISKEFVEMHGGHMWVDTQVGVGSTFSFTIPLHPQPEQPAALPKGAELEESGPIILAVDDTPGVLDLYHRYLSKEGYLVVGLSDASDLIPNVLNLNPAAILMDLNLPGKSGWEAIAEVQKHEAVGNIPIIICSIDDERQQALEIGIENYLIKPILEEDLIRMLEEIVERPVEASGSIVLIDGDRANATKVADMLGDTYHVRSTGLGYEGLQAIDEESPILIIMSLDIPDMDAVGLMAALRTHDVTKDLPILIIANRELTEADKSWLEGGPTHVLQKDSYTSQDLLDGMAALLAKAR